MGTTEQEIRDVAKRAAELIRERGWTQGAYTEGAEPCTIIGDEGDVQWRIRDCGGPLCLVGAVALAEGRPIDFYDHAPEADGCSVLDRLNFGAVEWNDAPERTAAEVIAVLERVAAGEGVA